MFELLLALLHQILTYLAVIRLEFSVQNVLFTLEPVAERMLPARHEIVKYAAKTKDVDLVRPVCILVGVLTFI